MEFKDWLNEKFLQWERSQPRRQSYSAFARFLGVSQPSVSQWLFGSNTPSLENVGKIADKLGPEIYDVLGLIRPNDELDFVRDVFVSASPSQREELNEIIEEWAREHGLVKKK